MSLAKEYAETKPIGVMGMGNWGGLEVLEIVYDIEDYVITCFDFGSGRKNFSKSKIRFTNPKREEDESRPFFIKFGKRYYLDEIMRTNF